MPTDGEEEKSITLGEMPPPTRPEAFRLPRPGCGDPYWGLSRSWYYNAEKLGWLKLIRICSEGRRRGVTLVPYRAVEAFIAKQGTAQHRQA
jgi:hypothetical protein